MNNKIKLENLELVIFDKRNIEHINFLKELNKDENIKKRFQGLAVGLIHAELNTLFGNGYFVSKDNKLIGYVYIGNINKVDKSTYLRAALKESERGKNLGKLLLNEVSDFIFKNYNDVAMIRVKVADDNKASLGIVKFCGYEWSDSDFYIKYNPYLEKEMIRQRIR